MGALEESGGNSHELEEIGGNRVCVEVNLLGGTADNRGSWTELDGNSRTWNGTAKELQGTGGICRELKKLKEWQGTDSKRVELERSGTTENTYVKNLGGNWR